MASASDNITYDASKFNPQPSSEFLCAICHCVLYQPRMCACRHIFCRSCIETWLNRSSTCPSCRSHTTMRQLQLAPPLVQSVLNSLTMDCDNKDKGCTYPVPMEHFPSHIAHCDFRAVDCPHQGCKIETTAGELAHHKEECQFRTELCRKDCRLPFPAYQLDSHDCVSAMRDKVEELNSIVHRHQVVMKWLRSKLNAMYMPQQSRIVQLHSFHETLNDVNHYWPPDQPIPLRLCGTYIASAPSSSATSTSQTCATEVSSEPSTQRGNSILERLVLEASGPQAQRRQVFTPRLQDEVEGPTVHVRRDYPLRGVERAFDTRAVHVTPETPSSPSRDPFNSIPESPPTNPPHIPLESLRPHTLFVHRVLPNPQLTSHGAAQSSSPQPPQRISPEDPIVISPTAFRSRVRSRSPTPFPEHFRTERDDDRSYQSVDTTDDDISAYSSPPFSEDYAPPRTYSEARRDDYDMYWSYRHRRGADSGEGLSQYLTAANTSRVRSPSYYSRSRSRSSRSRSRSIYSRSSRSRSRSYSRSWSRDSRPRSYSPRGADRNCNQFRTRSRSDWRLEQVSSPRLSQSRSHSLSPSRRTSSSRGQTRSQRPRRSRSNSSTRRLSRSRSRSRTRRLRRQGQSWNHDQSRSHSGSYHSSEPDARYSDHDMFSSSNWEGSAWDDDNANGQSSEERSHWSPEQNHTNDTQDDNSSDRHGSWHSSIPSGSQSRNEGYQSSGGSSRESRHSASGSSSSHAHETPSGGSQQLNERTSDDSSNTLSCVWVAPKSPNFSQNGSQEGDENWSIPTGTDELSDQEIHNWPASDSEAGERDDRSSPSHGKQVPEPTRLSPDGSVASDHSGRRQASRHSSLAEATSSLDLSPSSDSSKASAWHARPAQSSKKAKRGDDGCEKAKTSDQQEPGCSSEAKSNCPTMLSKKHNEDEQKQGDDTAQASSDVKKPLDQETQKNVWESSSDTTLLDYDLPDEEASFALSPKPHASSAHNGTNTSHDELCSEQDVTDPAHGQTNVEGTSGDAAGNSPRVEQSRTEDHQHSRETGNQPNSDRGEQSSCRRSDSDREDHSKGRKGKRRKDYKGKGKALLKSKKTSTSRRVLDSDSERNSGSDFNLKPKSRHPVLSSSEDSDPEKAVKAGERRISVVSANGPAKASNLPSTSRTVLASAINTSASKEEVSDKKAEKARKKDSAHTSQSGERHSHSRDRHSKKRKANKNKESDLHKKARVSDRTAVAEHEGGGLRSFQSTSDVRQCSLPSHHQRQHHAQPKRHSQATVTASLQSNLHSSYTAGTTSSQRTVSESLELGQSESRPRPETVPTDRLRLELDSSSQAGSDALARLRRRNIEGVGGSSRVGRVNETSSVGESTPYNRIMRVERVERGGGRPLPAETHSRRIMRIENSSGRPGTSPRNEAGESMRMVRIPDLPVPPSTLDLLNQYAYTENFTDDSDSTWSPSSSDEI